MNCKHCGAPPSEHLDHRGRLLCMRLTGQYEPPKGNANWERVSRSRWWFFATLRGVDAYQAL